MHLPKYIYGVCIKILLVHVHDVSTYVHGVSIYVHHDIACILRILLVHVQYASTYVLDVSIYVGTSAFLPTVSGGN